MYNYRNKICFIQRQHAKQIDTNLKLMIGFFFVDIIDCFRRF